MKLNMNKIDTFNLEYTYLKDDNNVLDLKFLVNLLPDYFFEIPASSTGNYHPKFALNKKGLVRHTKVAVRMAYELLNTETFGNRFSDKEKDIIIMALVLHDGLKNGDPKSDFTRSDHPLLISKLIMENKDNLKMAVDDIRLLCCTIESHMGQWNLDNFTKKEILPKPKTEMQRFVHMCDFLASRQFLDVRFENDEIINNRKVVKKLNNKGFTLVELLGVIVILIAILLIAIPSVTSSIERSKNSQLENKKELIISAAELYISDIRTPKTSCLITLDVLKSGNYITSRNIIDPYSSTDEEIKGAVIYKKDASGVNYTFCAPDDVNSLCDNYQSIGECGS